MDELIRVFLDDPTLLDGFQPIYISDNENDEDRLLVEFMIELRSKGIKLTPAALRDILGDMKSEHLLEHLAERLNAPVERDPDFVIRYVKAQYNDRVYFKLFNDGLRLMNDKPTTEEVERFIDDRRKQVAASSRANEMAKAVPNVFLNLRKVYESGRPDIHRTGYIDVDENIGFAPRQVIVVAAKQKVGKTRWVRAIVNGMLQHQPHLRCKWFSWEMSEEELIALDIAAITGIETGIVRGRKGMPDDRQFDMIMKTEEMLSQRQMVHYTQRMTMSQIRRENADADRNTLIILDNLGLVVPEESNDVQQDNFAAGMIAGMRDETDACIIPIHHLSKAVEHWSNRANFFEPSVGHVRGSARIIDYANGLIIPHRVSQYPELETVLGAEKWAKAQNTIQIKCEAMRDSAAGSFKMKHEIEKGRFFDYQD